MVVFKARLRLASGAPPLGPRALAEVGRGSVWGRGLAEGGYEGPSGQQGFS